MISWLEAADDDASIPASHLPDRARAAPQLLGKAMGGGDELTFATRTRSYGKLAIFAVDEHRRLLVPPRWSTSRGSTRHSDCPGAEVARSRQR
jgi:hypothetical protein